MTKSNNRGFVLAILPVLILLGGLVIGTFLVRQNTNLLQKAAEFFGSTWVNAASLDGNSYIVVTGSEGITPKAGFTAEAWIKPAKTEFYSHVFSRKSPLGGDTFYLSVQSQPIPETSSLKVTYIFGVGSGQNCSNISAAMQERTILPFELTSWQHLAGVLQNDGRIDIFVNGKRSIGKTIVSSFCSVNVPYTIGARSGGGKVDAQFTGLLEDVRISNTAKYQNDFTPPNAPLTPDSTSDFVLYKFDLPGACNVETQKCYTSNYSPGKYDGELIGKISFVGSMLPTPSPLPTTTSTPISVSPRPTTTSLPTPTATPSICKTGINSFSVDTPCENGNYRYATYSCYDGYKVRDGGPTSCKSSSTWRSYAEAACQGRSTCPTPIATSISTPTVRPTPTSTSNTNPPLCGQSSIPPATGYAPLTVTLFGAGNSGKGPGLDGYRWDFESDGAWDTGVSIDPIKHTYTRPGIYQPAFQVHGINNIWSATCKYPYPVKVLGPTVSPTPTRTPTSTIVGRPTLKPTARPWPTPVPIPWWQRFFPRFRLPSWWQR
jgi:hypothetical protein